MSNVYKFIEQSVIKACQDSVSSVSEDIDFFNDLGLDSIDFINVVYEIDAHFGIKVPIGKWMSEVNEGDAEMGKYFVMQNFVDEVQSLINVACA